MAKYIINRTSKGPMYAECAVLDENCLANTYTVQMNDGTIRDVDKRRVTQLDILDEAVLDRLKKFATKLWDKIVTVGKYIYTSIAGHIIPAQTPINTMTAAKEIEGLSFIPSSNLAALAEEQGITAEEVIDEQDHEESEIEFAFKSQDFWARILNGLADMDLSSPSSVTSSGYSGLRGSAYESNRPRFARRERLYEARNKELKMEDERYTNIDSVQLKEMILEQYNSFLSQGAKSSETTPIPLLIWGAPGIGKTQIIKGLVRELREEGINANMISVDAQAMRKDDWALPGQSVRTIKTALKGKDGEDVTLSVNTAIELPKSWLPTYDPSYIDDESGMTRDMLDDIANGGDGTGNGDGGFFFIDEISRIAPDVNNFIMTLLQKREFQGHPLGSRWMIIAAGNRVDDLGDNARLFHWDNAQSQRFQHYNLVPKFEDWLEWAESPIPGTDIPHIDPVIVEFLKTYPNLWYYSKTSPDCDKVLAGLYANPRAWENVTKAIREAMSPAADPRMAKLLAKHVKRDRSKRLSVQQMKRILAANVGGTENKGIPQIFGGWAGFDALFTTKDAKDVWKLGDTADVKFTPNNVTITSALDKIMANYPNKNLVPVPGKKIKRVGLKPVELENVIKYLIKCVDAVDERQTSGKDPILKAIESQLMLKLSAAPYHLELQDPTSQDNKLFAPVMDILFDRKARSINTLIDEE